MKTLLLTAISALLLVETTAAQHVVDAYAGLTDVSYEALAVVTSEPVMDRSVDAERNRTAGAALASFFGSGIGAVGGAYLGASMSQGSEPWGPTLLGALVGSVVGGATGAAIVTDNLGESFLGSLMGSALGIAAMATGGGGGLLYPVIHSITTAVVATN